MKNCCNIYINIEAQPCLQPRRANRRLSNQSKTGLLAIGSVPDIIHFVIYAASLQNIQENRRRQVFPRWKWPITVKSLQHLLPIPQSHLAWQGGESWNNWTGCSFVYFCPITALTIRNITEYYRYNTQEIDVSTYKHVSKLCNNAPYITVKLQGKPFFKFTSSYLLKSLCITILLREGVKKLSIRPP